MVLDLEPILHVDRQHMLGDADHPPGADAPGPARPATSPAWIRAASPPTALRRSVLEPRATGSAPRPCLRSTLVERASHELVMTVVSPHRKAGPMPATDSDLDRVGRRRSHPPALPTLGVRARGTASPRTQRRRNICGLS